MATNRPFPISLQPLFQRESACEVFVSLILKLDLITITKISHSDSL